jgi:hypothetical protein
VIIICLHNNFILLLSAAENFLEKPFFSLQPGTAATASRKALYLRMRCRAHDRLGEIDHDR